MTWIPPPVAHLGDERPERDDHRDVELAEETHAGLRERPPAEIRLRADTNDVVALAQRLAGVEEVHAGPGEEALAVPVDPHARLRAPEVEEGRRLDGSEAPRAEAAGDESSGVARGVGGVVPAREGEDGHRRP